MSKQTELAQVADTITVNSGNVGIGTSSPAADLHVNSGAGNLAGLFESTDAGATISLIDNGTTGGSAAEHGLNTVGNQLEIRAVDNLSFETGGAGSERMRIDSIGNVGIGYSSNLEGKFSVNGFGVFVGSNGTTPPGNNPAIARINSSNEMGFFNGGSERMRIDSAGRVTMPYQPAFVANTAPSTLTDNVDIVWSATALNRGSVYNTSNGRFTAPVAGLYQFFASVRIENAVSAVTYHRISFKHNGSYVTSSRSQLNHRTATGYWSHSSNDQAIYLNLNDYVNVTFETSGGSSSFSTSARNEHVFYGYLLG